MVTSSFLGRGGKDGDDAANKEEEDVERMIMMAFDPPRQKEGSYQLNPEHQGVVGRKLLQASIPTWTQLGADIDGEAADDWSGWSVSLSGDGSVLAVGAVQNDGSGSTNSGHVRAYKYNANSTSTWIQLGADIDGETAGDYSGWSVSLSSDGGVLAVGAAYNDAGGHSNSGHVRVYTYYANTTTWTQLGADIDGESACDYFGNSVSLSSNGGVLAAAALGSDENGPNTGFVRVYKYSNTSNTWTPLGAKINGEADNDLFGRSVTLSSDGGVLAVGAEQNDGNGGSTNSGHVRVYKYNENSNTWIQLGADIDGEAAGDGSGWSVSLSSDGGVLAVGAVNNDGNGGIDSGHVRVYKYLSNNNTWSQLGADIDGEFTNDYSGSSISLSGDGVVLAVAAYSNDGAFISSDRGHVRVYKYYADTATWTQFGADIDGEAAGDNTGYLGGVSLSSDGEVLAVGASYNDGNGSSSGHVRVFSIQVSLGTKQLRITTCHFTFDLSCFSLLLPPTTTTSFPARRQETTPAPASPPPSFAPTSVPTSSATASPSSVPSNVPTILRPPTTSTAQPSTRAPTYKPTGPTRCPTRRPTAKPTRRPRSTRPTRRPTAKPSTRAPTYKPTPRRPTAKPTTP